MEGRAFGHRWKTAMTGSINISTLFDSMVMCNVLHKTKIGENTGTMMFWSKEKMLEIVSMKEVRNSVEVCFERGKGS